MGWTKGPRLPDDHSADSSEIGTFGADAEFGAGEQFESPAAADGPSDSRGFGSDRSRGGGDVEEGPHARRRAPTFLILALVLIVISIINALTRST